MVGRGDQWIHFDRSGYESPWNRLIGEVIIVDRWASHLHNPDAGLWNKMALPIFEHVPARSHHCLALARERLLESLNIKAHLVPKRKVVYIDRQATERRLPDETHEELLNMYEDTQAETGVEIRHLKLEDMPIHEQVEVVADASVSISYRSPSLCSSLTCC